MTIHVGEKVKVLYTDQLRYIFQVEMTATSHSDEFTARVEAIFGEGDGEVTGGDILKWKGHYSAHLRGSVFRP